MKRFLYVLAVALAAGLSTPAFADTASASVNTEEFTTLQGVDALALGTAEMDQIHGALTGLDIWNVLVAKAQLITDPVLQQKVLDYLNTNKDALIRYFNFLLSFRR